MDQNILSAPIILVGRDTYGNKEYSGEICQIIGSYKAEKIHLLCMNMCLHGYLKRSTRISHLEYQDEDWIQTIDYEHIPFRCRKFHEHGHLFRDFPLNSQGPNAGEASKRMDSP
jgi:hypothetical protein